MNWLSCWLQSRLRSDSGRWECRTKNASRYPEMALLNSSSSAWSAMSRGWGASSVGLSCLSVLQRTRFWRTRVEIVSICMLVHGKRPTRVCAVAPFAAGARDTTYAVVFEPRSYRDATIDRRVDKMNQTMDAELRVKKNELWITGRTKEESYHSAYRWARLGSMGGWEEERKDRYKSPRRESPPHPWPLRLFSESPHYIIRRRVFIEDQTRHGGCQS